MTSWDPQGTSEGKKVLKNILKCLLKKFIKNKCKRSEQGGVQLLSQRKRKKDTPAYLHPFIKEHRFKIPSSISALHGPKEEKQFHHAHT